MVRDLDWVKILQPLVAEINNGRVQIHGIDFQSSSISFKNAIEQKTMKQIKIIVEKHTDGYVSYPLGLQGVVVGEGDSYEEALKDIKSAILFHVETFGESVLESDSSILEAFVAEASL